MYNNKPDLAAVTLFTKTNTYTNMKQLLYYKFCSFVYKGSPGMDTDTDTHHLKCKNKTFTRIQKLKAFESNKYV